MSQRPYRQTARAEAVETTRRRIIDAFLDCARQDWFDDITLDDVAKRADVTVRTVIRQFGGKEGLIAGLAEGRSPEISARRTVTPGDVVAVVDRLFEDYEADGDTMVRSLAQELRYPAVEPLVSSGRRGHRRVTSLNFAPWLEALPPERRDAALDALVIATDVYTWKLLRRDMGRSDAEARATMRALIEGVLGRFSATAAL
jgi:AcrR family transcriptional regulator